MTLSDKVSQESKEENAQKVVGGISERIYNLTDFSDEDRIAISTSEGICYYTLVKVLRC